MKNVYIAAAVVVALSGSAQATNVLVWGTGELQGFNNVENFLEASGAFTSVDTIQSNAALDLATLNSYDRVLYYSNTSQDQDADAIGDVLHQFALTGKRLVLATFAWANQNQNTLAGDIIELGTSPLVFQGTSFYTNVTMASNDGSEFFTGVNSLAGFYHDNVAVTDGATLRGVWSDNSPLLATKGNVVAVNLFPNDSYGLVSGDYQQLFVNSLIAIPAPGMGAFAGVMVLAVARRRR